jgi:hypothetical protein
MLPNIIIRFPPAAASCRCFLFLPQLDAPLTADMRQFTPMVAEAYVHVLMQAAVLMKHCLPHSVC